MAAFVAAIVFLWASLPPRTLVVATPADAALRQRTIAGAFHVHSTKSDGTATRAEILAAAARAGLQFVVFTDHGDATRPPDAPAYVSGVLAVDAVEVSTDGGHYVAIGLPAAPYRLGGDPSGVAADVRRLGGFGIAAHPDSPKQALAWHDWSVDIDGLEWLNADSAWRDRSWQSLARTLTGYFARPGSALARLLDRPTVTLARWDRLAAVRPLPSLAAHDAHGGPRGSVDEGRRFGLPRIPSYESSFRSFTTRVVLSSPLGGDAAADGPRLMGALRAGSSYTVLDGLAAPGWVELRAERQGRTVAMGEELPGAGPARLTVRAPLVPGGMLVVLRNGTVVAMGNSGEVSLTASAPGAYRAEVRLPGLETLAPWVASNPISIDLAPRVPPTTVSALPLMSLLDGAWRTEHDPSSTATIARAEQGIGVTLQLSAEQGSAFAAAVVPLPQPTPRFDAVILEIVAERPARLSVQFRSADGSARWRQSVYVSPVAGQVVLRTSDLTPADRGTSSFDPAAVASLLIVADLVNSVPGASHRLIIRQAALARLR